MPKNLGIQDLRAQLGHRVDLAHYQHEITIIEKHGEPRAVLVPYAWWLHQQQTPPDSGTPTP